MRITSGMMVQNTIRNTNNNLNKLSKYQDQISSEKKIQVPSEDPVAAARSLKLKSYKAEIEQQQKNADDADSWMKYSDNALEQIGDSITEIRDLVVQASNGTLTDNDKSKIQSEIEELKNGIIQIANSNYSGRYVFAGYSTDEAPFEIVSTDVGEKVTYNGKYLSLGGPVSTSYTDAEVEAFYRDNMDMVSGQPELTSASFGGLTISSASDFKITLDGTEKTVSLDAGTYADTDSLVSTLQTKINAQFPSDTGQPDPLIKVSNDDGKIVLTAQTGSSIKISNGSLNVNGMGFSNGARSTVDDSEQILYKMGANNRVTVNVEGCDIFGQGSDSLFDTITKIEMALEGETQYKTAAYTEGPPAEITVETSDLDLSSLLDDLDKDSDRLLKTRADLGARTSYVELTQNRLEDNYTIFSDLLSKNDDTDLAEASAKLASAQAAYSSSLSVGAKVIQNSLLDFLT